MPSICILSNYRLADQRSMLGYSSLLLEAARRTGYTVSEFIPRPVFGGHALAEKHPALTKLLRNLDLYLVSPFDFRRRSADILHIADQGNAHFISSSRCARNVITIHDLIPLLRLRGELGGGMPSRTGARLLRKLPERLRRADALICVSEATRRDVVRLCDVAPERVTVIHNALFQPMRRESDVEQHALRRELDIPAAARIVLNVSGPAAYKNRPAVLRVFAKVAARNQAAVLLVVGMGRNELEEMARALNIAERLRVVDRLSPEKLAKLYATSSVLLFPSFYEGFGYPVLEAQACGLPVVSSNRASLPEVGGDAALYREPLDEDGLAEDVLRVIEDKDLAQDLSDRGLENVRRFSPAAWSERIGQLYHSLSGGA